MEAFIDHPHHSNFLRRPILESSVLIERDRNVNPFRMSMLDIRQTYGEHMQ